MIYNFLLQITFALIVTSKFVHSTTKHIQLLDTTSYYACPDYINTTTNETVTLSTCTGCDLCGDGSLCPACDPLVDPSPTDAWICADYFNPLTNLTVSGEACSNCDICGDGSTCPACPDLVTVAPTVSNSDDNATFVPTSLVTSAPTASLTTSTPTVEVTTIEPTVHVPQFAICPDFYDPANKKTVTGLACSDCQYCGDIICPACKSKKPINQPTITPTVSFEPTPSDITSDPTTSEPTVSFAPTIDQPLYAICPDFFDTVLNKVVSGLGCSDCQWCGDKLCPACRTKKPSVEPTSQPTSEPTLENTSTIGVCPDFYLEYNLVSGEPCSGCSLCGDGSTCPVCTDPESIEPEGVCPTYLNDQNVTVQGETCKGCTSCGDGSLCVVCPSYLALIGGTTEAPTIAASVEPSVSLEPTMSFQPSMEPTISIEPTSEPSTLEPTMSFQPSMEPTISFEPTMSHYPSVEPTISSEPSVQSTNEPTEVTSNMPSIEPTITFEPSTAAPSTAQPTSYPSITAEPSVSIMPSVSSQPTGKPSTISPTSSQPSARPSTIEPSTSQPSGIPSVQPSVSSEPTVSFQPTSSIEPTSTDQPVSQAPIAGGGAGGSKSNTISAGAAAGIAVGGFVFAVLCLGTMFYVCFFMGKDKKSGKVTKRNNTNKDDLEFSNVANSPGGDSERRASFGISPANLDLESARSHSNLMV